jgi:hypothetical protein
MRWIKTCLDAHFEVVNTYQKTFYDDFFTLMGGILGRLHFEKLTLLSDPEFSQDDIPQRLSLLNGLSDLVNYSLDLMIKGMTVKMNKQSFYDYFYDG